MADQIKNNNDFMARLLANVDPEARDNMLGKTGRTQAPGKPAPAEKNAAPAPQTSAPAEKKTAPASAPAEKNAAPAERNAAPASAQTNKKASPPQASAPMSKKASASDPLEKTAPAGRTDAPAEAETEAAERKPARTGRKPSLFDRMTAFVEKKTGGSPTPKKRAASAPQKDVPDEEPAADEEPAGEQNDASGTDPALIAEIVSDMAFENEDRYRIPVRRGHDKSLRFWFDPMSPQIWDGNADLIYRDELSVDNNAAHQLLLPFIRERFEGKFLFRNELNLLPMDAARLLRDDFRQAAVALKRGDLKNPALTLVAENLTIDILVPEEVYNEKYLSAGPFEKRRAVRENLPVAAEFYMTAADYLDEMIRRYTPKGFTSIAISAPV